MEKHTHLIFNKHPIMISYKKIFESFGCIWFVLPKDNQIIKEKALLSKCQMFSIEKFGSSIECCVSNSNYDFIPVNGYDGYYNYLTVPKETYYKLWRNIIT